MSEGGRLVWASGTTITAEAPDGLLLSVPALARAWRLDKAVLLRVLRWMDDPSGPPPAVLRPFAEVGVLLPAVDAPPDDHARTRSPVQRFHEWANHDLYRDGADPTGAVREATVARFDPEDIERLRSPDAEGPSFPVLAADLADVVWQGSLRMRENRLRVKGATDARALLFSYGSAHHLVVVDEESDLPPVALADLARFGHGRPLEADPAVLLQGTGSRGVLVVGHIGTYQRRYRHDKAMRGFLVDGGRVLGEIARAAASRFGSATVSDGPLSRDVVATAGLDAAHFVAVGVVAVPPGLREADDRDSERERGPGSP